MQDEEKNDCKQRSREQQQQQHITAQQREAQQRSQLISAEPGRGSLSGPVT